MNDTPQLLALMQKTRDMRAYDCVKEFESLARKLEKENIALRADIQAHEQINKQLIEDKRRLDWLLTDDGGFWVNWMYDKDEWTPELKASRDAIDACRNGRIGREKP